ncbi:MAG TPA: SEC-C domain-containing protein [Polyangiaceae bacterium]
MSKHARNEPCPCGSGKKYKHCHWETSDGAVSDSDRAMRMHDLDRRLVGRLLEFAVKEYGTVWLDMLVEYLDVELDEQFAIPCGVYEWRSESGTLLEIFLQESPAGLTERERAWLDAQRRAWLSVWEVKSVTPGLAISVRDLFTGEERYVFERGGSQVLSPRDCVLGRVVDFEGVSVFCGMHSRILPPRPAAALVDAVRKAARLGSKNVPPAKILSKVPLDGWAGAWRDMVEHEDRSRMRIPQLRNTDGDPLLLTSDRFDFPPSERAAVETALAKLTDVDGDEGGTSGERVFVFHRPGNAMHKSWDNTIVGRAVVHDATLVVETNSTRRADDLRANIERALDGLVRHRVREHQDPEAMLERARSDAARGRPPKKERSEAPAPEALEMLRQFKERHYEDWLDTPLPALAGMTPREAAAKPRKRSDVALMLKELENIESRVPPDQRIDVSALWNELGLREGTR